VSDRIVQRRLAAILAADVVGYTRLVEQDTDGTVAAWTDARDDIIKPFVRDNSGTMIKFTGDGFLAEFPSVLDAVTCAMDMQEGLDSNSLNFRMGINVGDTVDDGGDIHGEGVNIAARIEALAAPGGICITADVYNQVHNRISTEFSDMGEHEVKNVSRLLQVYAIGSLEGEIVAESANLPESVDRDDEKPSIAVLPFDNMSGDPDHESFADGMTEDLITDLSKISGLFVVARNSTFAFKGKPVDIKVMAINLGVRYVLEGSVRKSGERVRINVQLIEASTGGHLWADRYDGTINDVFELQDEVGAKVVSALSVQITQGEAERLKTIHTHNLEAYELFVQAKATPYPPIPERIDAARQLFEQVIDMDPEFAGGYAGVSAMLAFHEIFGHDRSSETIERAEQMARKGINLDPTFSLSYTGLGMALLLQNKYKEAIMMADQAVKCQPSDADAHAYLGMVQSLDGQHDVGKVSINRAHQLNPQFLNGPYLNMRGLIFLVAGDYKSALDSLLENINRQGPVGPPAICFRAACYAGLGQMDDAVETVKILQLEFPDFTTKNWTYLSLIRDDPVRDTVIELMGRAGIRDT